MKIAIVGVEGYIGRALRRHLLTLGHTVMGFDKLIYNQKPHYTTLVTGRAQEMIEEFLRARPDAIVWLAAYAHDPKGVIPEPVMYDNNARLPLVVAEWASAHETPFIAMSSLSVLSPTKGYPESKRQLERGLWGIGNYCRFVDILRFGTVYGVARHDDTPESFRVHLLLNSMVFSALNEGVIRVSAPYVRRPVFHIRDTVRVITATLTYDGPRGRILNFYSTSGTLSQYAEAVHELVPAASIQISNDRTDQRDYGWGEFQNVMLDLTPLVSYTQEHLDEIRENFEKFKKWKLE